VKSRRTFDNRTPKREYVAAPRWARDLPNTRRVFPRVKLTHYKVRDALMKVIVSSREAQTKILSDLKVT